MRFHRTLNPDATYPLGCYVPAAMWWGALIAGAIWSGPLYDYPPYMVQWAHVLAGMNPWLTDADNVYGPIHQSLALLFAIQPLLPKMLFVLCWFGSFLLIAMAAAGNRRISAAVFALVFFSPFFIVLVCFYGSEDILVAGLALLALDLRVRQNRPIVAGLALAIAGADKIYPLILLPLFVFDGMRIDRRFLAGCSAALAIAFAVTAAIWGISMFRIVGFASVRPGKLLSIVPFLLDSRLSPIAGGALARDISKYDFLIVAVCMATTYVFCWHKRVALTRASTISAIVLLLTYKVGNPQYFLFPTLFLIYLLATEHAKGHPPHRGVVVAIAAYLAILNLFEMWYFATHASFQYPAIRATIGLPMFLAGSMLVGQLAAREFRQAQTAKT